MQHFGSGTGRSIARASAIHSAMASCKLVIASRCVQPSAMQPGRSGARARKPQPSSSERAKISTGYSGATGVRAQPAKATTAIAPVITPTTKPIAAIKIVVIPDSELAPLPRQPTKRLNVRSLALHPVVEPSTPEATAHNKTYPATLRGDWVRCTAIWEPPQQVTIGGVVPVEY